MAYSQYGRSKFKMPAQQWSVRSRLIVSDGISIALLSLMLLIIIASPTAILAAEQHSSTLTSTAIEINRHSGGPGTVVQVRGVDARMKLDLFLAVLGTPQAITGSRFPDLNGPIALLGTAQGQGEAGTFTTTVTIPATWSSGKPIAETELCIVAGAGGYFSDFKPFAFAPAAMPKTGDASRQGWLNVILLAVGCIIVGVWVLNRATFAHKSSKQY